MDSVIEVTFFLFSRNRVALGLCELQQTDAALLSAAGSVDLATQLVALNY